MAADAAETAARRNAATEKLEFMMQPDRPVAFYDHPLPDHEVHVWRTGVGVGQSALAQLRQVLSPKERERADRFHFDTDRRRCTIGRGSLRLLLGRLLDLPANELQFEYDEFGKPRLIPRQGGCLQFNVSHSGGLILLAISMGRRIGVDLEKVRLDLDFDGIAARFFSASEYNIWASLAGQAKQEAFFACWTRREAFLKACGAGLSMPPGRFDVAFLSNEEPRLLETRPDRNEASRWSLRALQPEPGYCAALAVEGSAWSLKCLDFHYGDSWH